MPKNTNAVTGPTLQRDAIAEFIIERWPFLDLHLDVARRIVEVAIEVGTSPVPIATLGMLESFCDEWPHDAQYFDDDWIGETDYLQRAMAAPGVYVDVVGDGPADTLPVSLGVVIVGPDGPGTITLGWFGSTHDAFTVGVAVHGLLADARFLYELDEEYGDAD